MEAFVRIAPCMTLISDSVSARPQFETLTAATSCRMPFALYQKYLRALDKYVVLCGFGFGFGVIFIANSLTYLVVCFNPQENNKATFYTHE